MPVREAGGSTSQGLSEGYLFIGGGRSCALLVLVLVAVEHSACRKAEEWANTHGQDAPIAQSIFVCNAVVCKLRATQRGH